MSYRDSEDFAKDTSSAWRFVRGMIRRMQVTLTEGVKWQLLGQRGGQGGDETGDVVPYTGIGFYSRPPSSGTPEAVVARLSGAKAQAIIATRDEATRAAAAGDLEEGETCVYNDKAKMIVKKDGTVEIRLVGGVAVALTRYQDHKDLVDYVRNQFSGTGGHVHAVAGVATTTMVTVAAIGPVPPTVLPPAGTPTEVIKGQ